jgi:hypothetical protein
MAENIDTELAELLAKAFKRRTRFEIDTIEVHNDEVYVNLGDDYGEKLSGMDDLCVIAFDHDFVPQGIIPSGAARFRSR